MRKANKKVKEVNINLREQYSNIFRQVEGQVGNGLYREDAVLNKVKIEKFELDVDNYGYWDMLREIKKILIKNKLFISGIKQEDDTLIVETTNDLNRLLYVKYEDLDDEYVNELKEILEEIDNEDDLTDEEKQEIDLEWNIAEQRAEQERYDKLSPEEQEEELNQAIDRHVTGNWGQNF